MKFRFCGGDDCPDWLLMQINTLSALSVEHFQEMCGAVVQSISGNELNYGRMREIAKESNLDLSELKACLSGMNFILKSGTRYGVPPDELGAELEQLGLKSRHVAQLISAYSEQGPALTRAARSTLLRTAIPLRMDATLTNDGGLLMDMLTKEYNGRNKQINFAMSREQALLLLTEMKVVQSRMERLVAE